MQSGISSPKEEEERDKKRERERERERGFSLGDSYIIVHLEGLRRKSTIRCGRRLKLFTGDQRRRFHSSKELPLLRGRSQIREMSESCRLRERSSRGFESDPAGEILSRIPAKAGPITRPSHFATPGAPRFA